MEDRKKAVEEEVNKEREAAVKERGEEVVKAAEACDVPYKDISEAYQGSWVDDVHFVRDLLDGAIPSTLPAYVHIDWEWTAKEVMMEYCEDNGYYFRIL